MSIVGAVVLVTALMVALGRCLDAVVGAAVRNGSAPVAPRQAVKRDGPRMQPARSRLRIIDLLAWTLWCALVIECRKEWTDWDAIAAGERIYYEILHLSVAMAYGAALFAATLFGRRWWRGRAPLVGEPGHWLLVLVAAAAVIDGTATVLLQTPWVNLTRSQVHCGACCMVAFTGAVVASRMSQGLGWMAVVLLAVVESLALAALFLLAGVMELDWDSSRSFLSVTLVLGAAVALPLVGFVALHDCRRSVGRDWLHWVGVSVYVSLALLTLATSTRGFV
jgi:hypothetical protein